MIFIDFNDFIDVYSPISIVDVIRVIAYAMDRSATLREGGDPDQRPGYLQRLFDFMATHDLGLKEFGFEAYGGSLMLEFKNNPSFRQRLEAAVQGRFQRFVEDARTFIRQAVARILNADGANAERVVVIADALEKLTPLREEDRSLIEGCVETLYLSHQSLLQLPCHVIYTFPLWLRFRAANLGALYGREPLVLPMVKLAGREGQEFSVGVDKLVALVQRRVEDLGAVFGETLKDTLLPLVRASGGFPRDLLRMVRSLLLDAPAFPIRPEDTRRVVAELARTYEYTLLGTYFDVLAQVHRTQTMPADDLAARNLAGFLFERWLILAYHNGAEWFALHPLVLGSPRMQQHLKATAS